MLHNLALNQNSNNVKENKNDKTMAMAVHLTDVKFMCPYNKCNDIVGKYL